MCVCVCRCVCECVCLCVSVAGPVRCSWQGIDRSLVASARAVKIPSCIILLLSLLNLPGRQSERRYFCQGICPGTPGCGAATGVCVCVYVWVWVCVCLRR